MSDTNMRYAFERGGAIVRTTAADKVQVIRDGSEVASFDVHANHRASASREGLVVFGDGFGLRHVDVSAASPVDEAFGAALTDLGDVAVHPDGDRVLAFDTDSNTAWWVSLGGKRKKVIKLEDPDLLAYPEVALADDGETWAMLDGEDLAMGRGSTLTAYVHIGDDAVDLYPRTYAFDLANERLVLSGSDGFLTLAFKGGAKKRSAKGVSVVSPVVAWDGYFVAVIGNEDDGYEVGRFDATSLAPKGTVTELGRWQDPDGTFALLALADGSLAVVPGTKPIRILPAAGSTQAAGALVELVGAARTEHVPHPTARWYREEIGTTGVLPGSIDTAKVDDLRSLARFLLDELSDPRRIADVLRRNPVAFTPYASAVAGWGDDRIAELFSMLPDEGWRLAKGADDDATDALVARVKAAKDEAKQERLFLLLVGIDTDHALDVLPPLARKQRSLKVLAEERSISIPKQGAAERRFADPAMDVVLVGPRKRAQPGLSRFGAVAARGADCAAPPVDVLSVDLSLLPGKPFTGTFHFLLSDCEACDESDAGYVTSAEGQILGSFDDGKLRKPSKRPSCEGEPAGVENLTGKLTLAPQQASIRFDDTTLGHVGGRPRWVQHPAVPHCPTCKRLAFFVGQAGPEATGAATLFGFHCETCDLGIQVVQLT